MKPKSPIKRHLFLAVGYALSGSYAAAAEYYFDVNGTTAGSGVVDGSSYAASGTTWNTVADGTGTPGGTIGTAFRGHTLVFSAGTDAALASYTMTAFASYQMSGVRIEDGNVSLVGGSGFSSPTILTKTGTSLNISGNWDFYGNWNTFNTEASSTLTFANLPNVSTRAVKLRKSGDGLLTIEGAATGRGITVEALGGELRIRNGNAMWTSGYTSTVTVNGGRLALDNNITVANNPITIIGDGYHNGSINLGALANHAGNNFYNSLITLGGNSRINNNAAGTTLTLNPATGNAVTGAFGLTMGGEGNITVSKPVDAAVTSLTKVQGGTLTLAGSHSYAGPTTISGGRLSISSTGTINSSGGVSIGAGEFNYNNSTTALTPEITFSGNTGTLSGTGTITPTVTITNGNRHTSGTSVNSINTTATIGSQTFANGITYNEGAIFEWNLNANNGVGIGTCGMDYDAVNALSLATTDTKAIFRVVLNGTDDFDEDFWNTDRTWSNIFTGLNGTSVLNIADYFKSTVEYYNSAGPVTNANATRGFSITGQDLNWTVVPEPATGKLAGLLFTAGLLRRRR